MRIQILAVAALLAAACQRSSGAAGGSSPAPGAAQPVVLRMVYGSEKKTWLAEELRLFEASGPRTASGRPIRVEATAMGSGESAEAIAHGNLQPHVYSPASTAYLGLLNRAWLSTAGRTQPVAGAAEPLVLSPVVIAMWKPMAEALGWPRKALGWSDLVAVNGGGKGWAAHGRPEWGAFKLGHTHPEFSNSGLLAVLAEAYAGAGKSRGLVAQDLAAKRTRDFITRVEGTIVHYGESTGFFAEKMQERGPSYLSAAVLYENLVIESYAKAGAAFPLVAIYPVEGTFWSDHPYVVLDAPWVGSEERDAAGRLQQFLRARPAQERALALGFRPADPAVPIGAPLDAAHGVDPKQPQTLLEVPDAAVLEAVLDAWRSTKKSADVILVFDKSGSMEGRPLAAAKAGARKFLETLGDRDEATLLFFDHTLYPPVGPLPLSTGRADLLRRVDEMIAGGGTALYDATQAAYALAEERTRTDRSRIHAVVIMTDGKDENSKLTFDALRSELSHPEREAPVKVFTIAFGAQAQRDVLAQIAEAAQGKSAAGDLDTIVAIYRDMGSFF
jgi:Ca-activated chloride channel family protein